MEIPTEVPEAKLDALGAHFKYRELFNKLTKAINEHLQEKRSLNLLSY